MGLAGGGSAASYQTEQEEKRYQLACLDYLPRRESVDRKVEIKRTTSSTIEPSERKVKGTSTWASEAERGRWGGEIEADECEAGERVGDEDSDEGCGRDGSVVAGAAREEEEDEEEDVDIGAYGGGGERPLAERLRERMRLCLRSEATRKLKHSLTIFTLYRHNRRP
jgi:hypothetical protein